MSRPIERKMWASTLISLCFVTIATKGCPAYVDTYYEELGCTPEALDETGCPTSYDCSSLSIRSPNNCYYQGNVYDEGHQLAITPPCTVHCRCVKDIPSTRVRFSCINVECPEIFRGPPPPGCHNVYEHDKCCSVRQDCDDDAEPKKAAEVCEYKGKTYKLGQAFYPEDVPCTKCICQPGYNGSLTEPTCRKVKCNLELHQASRINDGCVPVFYGVQGCCPIGWRCPASNDTIVAGATDSTPDSGKTCRFGELTLRVGDKLNTATSGRYVEECICSVPPHLLCMQTEREVP